MDVQSSQYLSKLRDKVYLQCARYSPKMCVNVTRWFRCVGYVSVTYSGVVGIESVGVLGLVELHTVRNCFYGVKSWSWWTAASCLRGVSETVCVPGGRGRPQPFLHASGSWRSAGPGEMEDCSWSLSVRSEWYAAVWPCPWQWWQQRTRWLNNILSQLILSQKKQGMSVPGYLGGSTTYTGYSKF